MCSAFRVYNIILTPQLTYEDIKNSKYIKPVTDRIDNFGEIVNWVNGNKDIVKLQLSLLVVL